MKNKQGDRYAKLTTEQSHVIGLLEGKTLQQAMDDVSLYSVNTGAASLERLHNGRLGTSSVRCVTPN